MKDKGMIWVIVANVMAIVVIGLLLCANYVERSVKKRELLAQKEAQKVALQQKENIGYKVAPELCYGVEGDVNVVLITDANYMDFTRVAINSAKNTKCEGSRYNFYVMTLDVSESDKMALKNLEAKNVKVNILEQKEVDLFYIRDTHVSKTSLLKYYIARELNDLDKVLFVDSDIMVLHDLTKLYNTDIEGKYLAAVKDPSWFFENTHVKELNLEERGFYFNSGVMLMNLAKIRNDNLIEKLEDYTNNNFRTYMDQDAYNVVVGNDVKLLDVENNTMNFFFEHNDINVLADFYNREWKDYQDVFGNAVIVHFASSKKPLGTTVDKNHFFYKLQQMWYEFYKPLPPLQ